MKTQFSLLSLFLATVLLAACSGNRSVPASSVSRGTISGDWTLTMVNFEGFPANYSVRTLFNDSPPECFTNSDWTFRGGGSGTYTLNSSAAGCTGRTQNIYWASDNSTGTTSFQFKKLLEGQRARDVTEGFRMDLVSGDGNTLVFRSPVSAGAQSAHIVYTFSKRN